MIGRRRRGSAAFGFDAGRFAPALLRLPSVCRPQPHLAHVTPGALPDPSRSSAAAVAPALDPAGISCERFSLK
jgi:hypothetical protein